MLKISRFAEVKEVKKEKDKKSSIAEMFIEGITNGLKRVQEAKTDDKK